MLEQTNQVDQIETKEPILDCGHLASPHGPSTTGYGTDKDGRTCPRLRKP